MFLNLDKQSIPIIINLDMCESIQLKGDHIAFTTTAGTYNTSFDSHKEAQKVYNALAKALCK